MPGFDPSGNFTRAHNWQADRDAGIRILADRHDAEDNNFAAAFNQTFLRNGVVPMSGDLNMGGKKINTIAAGTVLLPGLSFELNIATGLYQLNPNHIGFSVGGAEKCQFNASGAIIQGSAQPLALKAGTTDHCYMAFYPRTADPALMGGWAGFGSGPATPHLAVVNNTSLGAISISTKAGDGAAIELSPRGGLGFSVAVQGSLSHGAGTLRCQTTGAGAAHLGAAGAGIEIWSAGIQAYNRTTAALAPFTLSASYFGMNETADGTRGIVAIMAAQDPAITPAALNVRQVGVGGTVAAIQYGIRFDGNAGSSNQASHMYGVHSFAKQNVGGANTGVYGEGNLSTGAICKGVHGKATIHSGTGGGVTMVAGVYGEVGSSDNTSDVGISAAGSFEQKSVRGNIAVGVYASTVAGALNPQPLRCDHAGVNVFTVGPKGPMSHIVTGTGGPILTVNSTTSTQYKILFTDAAGGTQRGYLGADVNYAFVVGAAGTASGLFTVNHVGQVGVGGGMIYAGYGTTAAAANMHIDGSNAVLKSTSSLRYKKDIKALAAKTAKDIIMALNPITYVSKSEYDGPGRHYGLIAEEVAEIEPRLITFAYADKDWVAEKNTIFKHPKKGAVATTPEHVQYERLIVPLIKYIQELEARLQAAGI